MRFGVDLEGIDKLADALEAEAAAAITAAMREATDGLKADLRADVTKAGLGPRLANTWRGETYPKSGDSMEPAGFVYSKAEKLVTAFDLGVTIRAKGGKYLAIPTPDAGVKHTSVSKGSGRITPAAWERETGVKLRFVPTRSGGILVTDAFYRRQPVRYQRRTLDTSRKRFRPISDGGAGSKGFIVIFVLVKQTRLGKRLDVDGIARRWAERVPPLVAERLSVERD